jgi:outer membrane protein W
MNYARSIWCGLFLAGLVSTAAADKEKLKKPEEIVAEIESSFENLKQVVRDAVKKPPSEVPTEKKPQETPAEKPEEKPTEQPTAPPVEEPEMPVVPPPAKPIPPLEVPDSPPPAPEPTPEPEPKTPDPVPPQEPEPVVPEPGPEALPDAEAVTPIEKILSRIEVGTRMTTFTLDQEDGEVLGTIVGIEGEPNESPTKFFANVMVLPYLGVELSYDSVKARTRTSSGKSDGDIEMSGPLLSAIVRIPNQTGVIPYAGIGMAFFGADFSETAHWALGYEGPEEYEADGSPSEPLGGRERMMKVEDHTGMIIHGGLMWQFAEHWAVDVFVRQMEMESEATFTGTVNGKLENEKSGVFLLDNMSYGGGIRYNF